YNPPIADWTVDKYRLNIKDPVIQLEDVSKSTIGRTWIIDGKEYFFDKELTYAFRDTGLHHIRMIATDRFLCTDTLDTEVFIFRDFSLFMPNAFSPNGDGKNESFLPIGEIHSLESYDLKIYDRWGGKLFESSNPTTGWNGKFENAGKDLPPGVYVFDLYYKANRKAPVHERGTLSLIK
ncbi:MAG: gliding motility-associated C-terminal domain-containing protein, partial [Saprospiraceae bacterium]